MTPAEQANVIATWALWVSIAAAAFSLTAAGFAAWQAATAHWTRLADNEGAVVEWAPAEWVAADVIEVGSNGPDVALQVWARLNVAGVRDVQTARRLRPGESIRFKVSGHQVSWDWHARQEPAPGTPSTPSAAFYYGGLIVWRNRYGRRFSLPLDGAITRRVRLDPEPYPHDAEEPNSADQAD